MCQPPAFLGAPSLVVASEDVNRAVAGGRMGRTEGKGRAQQGGKNGQGLGGKTGVRLQPFRVVISSAGVI